MPSPKVIISGGGTGGHIFPAIAIANAIKEKKPNAEILFVGAKGRMEMEKVPDAGYKIEGLWISGLQRKLTLKNLSFPFKVISSLMNANKIIKNFQPDIAVGVGGYASGPLLKMATKKKVKTLIQEQNSYPGITNKLLGKDVNKICVAYQGMEKWFPKEKIVVTGNPVRKQVVELQGKRERALKNFGLSNDKKTLFVVGGSLGARSVNQSMKVHLEELLKLDIQILWQTGKLFIEEANTFIKDYKIEHVTAVEFIMEMDLAYAAADLIVSRAGAMAIAELCLVKKPCILVPFPYAAEDHQTKNAMALVNNDAAILIADKNCMNDLGKEVSNLIADEAKMKSMGGKLAELGFAQATEDIVKEIFQLIGE